MTDVMLLASVSFGHVRISAGLRGCTWHSREGLWILPARCSLQTSNHRIRCAPTIKSAILAQGDIFEIYLRYIKKEKTKNV